MVLYWDHMFWKLKDLQERCDRKMQKYSSILNLLVLEIRVMYILWPYTEITCFGNWKRLTRKELLAKDSMIVLSSLYLLLCWRDFVLGLGANFDYRHLYIHVILNNKIFNNGEECWHVCSQISTHIICLDLRASFEVESWVMC